MSWKYKFGQIIGIVVGVVAGGSLVHIAINAIKPKNTQYIEGQQLQYNNDLSQGQTQNAFVFDQVVANVNVKPAQKY